MTSPRFLEEARTIMASVLRLSREELASMLQLSPKLRDEVYARLRTFFDPEVTEMPAALSYTGMVFRKLSPSTFTAGGLGLCGRASAHYLLRLRAALARDSYSLRPYGGCGAAPRSLRWATLRLLA